VQGKFFCAERFLIFGERVIFPSLRC
jgi:hypothetical protein